MGRGCEDIFARSLDRQACPVVRSPVHGIAALFHREEYRAGIVGRPEGKPHAGVGGDDLDLPDDGWEQAPPALGKDLFDLAPRHYPGADAEQVQASAVELQLLRRDDEAEPGSTGLKPVVAVAAADELVSQCSSKDAVIGVLHGRQPRLYCCLP